ncbi:remodeling and spacing factor 1-like isoform X2 [Limulus polyphemus]|uniref:Remodeling and spacing factor 1-like isoform X2 n=1 Tax=Limulus polyphemus TaxID=6850 RepID=A0ABM1BPV2_LIMPO|nr:remodeling and spacing factor 1-like isoform X2 [Limulus polyphemus]
MASVEEDCHNNPNFAVICSFIIQFGETCGINLTIERLQEMLEDTKTLHEELRELHIKLLRKARKWFGKEKWEKALIKFCHQYSNVDAWEIERFGYKKAKLSVKLEALKRLLEMQFDTNSKFKTGINQQDASNLRLLPVGRDVKGLMYWYQVDEDLNLRIYSEEAENERSWKLLCKTRHDLATLLSSLEACGLQYVKDESSSVCSENGDSCITELSNKEKKPIKEELVENIVKQETSSINDKEDIKPQALDLSTTIAAKSENTTLENEEKLSLEIPVGAGITMKPCDVKTVSESQPMGIVVSSNKESPELSQIQNNVKTEETPVTEAGNSLLIDKSSHSDTNAETSKKELGHLKCQSVEQMQPLDLSRENNVEKNVQSVLIKEGISKLSHKQVQKQDKEELLSSHGGVSVTTVNMSTSKVPHTTEVSNHIGSVDILNSLVAEDSLSCKTSEGREFKHKIYYKKLDTHEKPELNLDKLSENTNSDKESVSQEKEIKIITECHLSLDSAKIAESLKNVPDANQKLNKDENNKKIVDLSSSTNDNRHSISKSEVLGSLSGENLTDSEAAKETDVNHVAKAENSNNDQADIKSEHSEQTAIKFSKEVNKPSVLAETNSEKDVCTSPLVNNENILQDKIDKLNTTKNPCAVSCNSTSEISTTIQELQTDCNEVDTIKSSTTHSLTIKEVDGIQDLQTSKNKESDSNKQSKINTDSLRVFEILQDSPGDENQINDNKKMNKAECDSTKENEDSAKKEQIENLSPQKKSDEQTKSYETVSVEAVPVESAEASTLENKTLDLEETVEEHKNAPKTKKKKSVRGRKLRSRKCNDMKKTAHKTPEKVIEKESGGDSESIESENNQKNLSCSEKKGEEASLTIPEEVILAAGKSPRRGRSRSRGRGRGRGRGRQVTRKGGLTPPSNSGTLKRGRGRGPKILNGSDGSDSPNLHIKRSRRIQEQQQKKLSELAEALEREQRHLEELAKKKVATTKEKQEKQQKVQELKELKLQNGMVEKKTRPAKKE